MTLKDASSHNTQPWLFRIAGQTLELRADRTRTLPVVDPEDRALVISCGAALFNLCVAIRRFGFNAAVELVPDSADEDLLARVGMGSRRSATEEDESLFRSIMRKRTNRLRFEDRPIPSKLLESLVALASEEGVWLEVLETEALRRRVADLVAEGDRVQGADRRFRRELAAWVHPNRSPSRAQKHGKNPWLYGLLSVISPVNLMILGYWAFSSAETGSVQVKVANGSPGSRG